MSGGAGPAVLMLTTHSISAVARDAHAENSLIKQLKSFDVNQNF
jgi:hypothetical protein